jgi:hypothetical protein
MHRLRGRAGARRGARRAWHGPASRRRSLAAERSHRKPARAGRRVATKRLGARISPVSRARLAARARLRFHLRWSTDVARVALRRLQPLLDRATLQASPERVRCRCDPRCGLPAMPVRSNIVLGGRHGPMRRLRRATSPDASRGRRLSARAWFPRMSLSEQNRTISGSSDLRFLVTSLQASSPRPRPRPYGLLDAGSVERRDSTLPGAELQAGLGLGLGLGLGGRRTLAAEGSSDGR